MNVAEWRDELRRLRIPPGPSVAVVFWRGYLDRNRNGPRLRHRECNRAVRMMSPLDRAAYNEGASLGRDARALRIGRREWLIDTPHAGERQDSVAAIIATSRR